MSRWYALPLMPLLATALSAARPGQPLIQVALLLDTSNSMDGLIDQARSQLWTLVNQFAPLRQDGRAPELQVALYEYGKSTIPAREGYLRQVVSFTTDLDRISQQLFALQTKGGDEYCGTVLLHAMHGLPWSAAPRDLKVIFIAGNEPFTQGAVDYRQSCELARSREVAVNTLFCGSYQEGIATQWEDGARRGGGTYMAIDQDEVAVHLAAPQDDEIARLGLELNRTYLPMGESGRQGLANQAEQDTNALKAGAGSVHQRAVAKASGLYKAEGWDLVDAERSGTLKLESLDRKELPKELQALAPSERRAYVDAKAKERTALQARIQKLSAQREAFLLQKRTQASGARTLDAAMQASLKTQALAKGFAPVVPTAPQ
jgi:hypothetical protein